MTYSLITCAYPYSPLKKVKTPANSLTAVFDVFFYWPYISLPCAIAMSFLAVFPFLYNYAQACLVEPVKMQEIRLPLFSLTKSLFTTCKGYS